MGCCGPGAELTALLPDARARARKCCSPAAWSPTAFARPTCRCPRFIAAHASGRSRRRSAGLPGVESARVNLSTKRVTVRWRADGGPPPFIETLEAGRLRGSLVRRRVGQRDGALSELIRALAVAGFAASNIMLLSVSIWSGAEAETRDLFHWLSTIIALPALAYSGRIFFRSAWRALRHGRTNMDVPISLGVLLAFGMSVYETVQHGPHAYFDAAISLLFFLLIGRTLDHMMRERARQAVREIWSGSRRAAHSWCRRMARRPIHNPGTERRNDRRVAGKDAKIALNFQAGRLDRLDPQIIAFRAIRGLNGRLTSRFPIVLRCCSKFLNLRHGPGSV